MTFNNYKRERERERERESERERQRQRQRQTETETERQTDRDRQTDRQTDCKLNPTKLKTKVFFQAPDIAHPKEVSGLALHLIFHRISRFYRSVSVIM